MDEIAEITIRGERMFSDVLGVATLAGKRYFLIASLIGRRGSMDYALPSIHKGEPIIMGKNGFHSIGAKRYMGKKGNLPDGIVKTLVIPNQNLQVQHDNEDNEDDALGNTKTLFWYEQADIDDMIWNSIKQSPIPMLDAWRNPIIQLLKDTSAIDDLREQNGLHATGEDRVTPIDFVIGNPLWGGLFIKVSDDDIAAAAQFLLRSGRIAA
jgi:hypothetical protein